MEETRGTIAAAGVLSLLVLCFGSAGLAIERHVPSEYATIEAAINDCNDGDTVIVAAGTYRGNGNRDIDFKGKAITVKSTDPNDPNVVVNTVIDCEGSPTELHRGFKFDSGEGPDSVLAGLTITNGYGPEEQINGSNSDGGAIFCKGSGPTITHCFITGNSSISHNSNGGGGGMFCYRSQPIITECTFTNNSAEYGAGLYCYLSDAIISNCTISSNSGRVGAGILCFNFRPVIRQCTIMSNSGHGFRCTNGYPTISHCYIIGNTKEGISSNNAYANIDNCIIAGNLRGIYSDYRSPIISNSTITENLVNGIYSKSCTPNIYNSILWHNGEAEVRGSAVITYSNVEGGFPGTGNIYAEPLFLRSGTWDANTAWVGGDYYLLRTSPCIDAGDPNYIPEPNETDIKGNPRLVDGDGDGKSAVDMGAYEPNYVEAVMHFTPQALNPGSKGRSVKAHVVLPDGYGIEEVDANTRGTLGPFGIESDYIEASIDEDGLTELEISFSRAELCAGIDYGPADVVVVGPLASGQYFYATDTVKISSNALMSLGILSSYWLEGGCGAQDWCGGVDVDHSSTVDFTDFALFDGCCIEVIQK